MNQVFNLKGVKSKKIFSDNYFKLKKEILLIVIGGVFVIESVSVILQIYYFKYILHQ